jgi:hypothetical protein
MDSQKYEHPESINPPNNSKCSATDAAAYVIAASLKSMADEDNKTKVNANEPVKCSDMIGKAQKECGSKQRELYDPLDEL